MEPFIGQIQPLAFTYAPRNWATCDGQILPIQVNTALFALIGTIYGGNGTTTFQLPDLRGRSMIHFGQGPGLQPYDQGQVGGSETTTLITANLPAHNHLLIGSTVAGTTDNPSNAFLATSVDQSLNPVQVYIPAEKNTGPVPLSPQSIGLTGTSSPFNNLSPFLVINVSIALYGVFPPRPD